MKYIPGESMNYYAAPFIGNGDMALQIGPDGSMAFDVQKSDIHANPNRLIWWEGRRYRSIQTKNLVPFGHSLQTVSKNGEALRPVSFEQTLDTDAAEIRCSTLYEDGASLDTEAFVHTAYDLIAVKKTLSGGADYSFVYRFCGKACETALPDFCECDIAPEENGAAVRYRFTDQKNCFGVVRVFCDSPVDVTVDGNAAVLTLRPGVPESVCFYLLFCDRQDGEGFEERSAELRARTLSDGFDAVKAVHGKVWADYYAEGGASIGDAQIDRVYRTAQYHLKCFTTRWSMPVGLNDASWEGKFFAFDEYFMFWGLVTSNHREAAGRVPRFRRNGLAIALQRYSSKGYEAARYPWETIEDGTEAATPGFWYEHIFHMATISLGAYEYWRFTGDKTFLGETAYPVIRACKEFFRMQMLYRVDGGKLIVGRCTDLERLGSGVQNPYMTTCSVIAALRAFADCGRAHGRDLSEADEAEKLSDELLAGLPDNGERYVPYPGCEAKSIAVYSGTFPFCVDGVDRELEKNAIEDYIRDENTFGNMYAVGSGVCSWYAAWQAVAYARLGWADRAFGTIRYVADTAGDFGEMFEINNKASATYYHPWFTTAAGMLVHAVNETLVQSEGKEIFLARGLTEETDGFSLKLAVRGGAVIEAEASGGVIRRLALTGGEGYVVHVPARFRVEASGVTGCTVSVG